MFEIKSSSASMASSTFNNLETEQKMDLILNSQTEDIFDSVFTLYGVLSSEGFVVDLKGRVFEKTETEPALLIGQRFAETVYWQSTEADSKLVEEAITNASEGNKSKITVNFRISAGETVKIELYVQPVTGPNNVRQIFFCAQQISELQKEVEYHKQRGERLLFAAENAEIGLWYWDLKEDTIFSTPKCNELFEISPYDVITLKSFLEIVHPEDRPQVEAALKESQTYGTEYNSEYRVIYSDGNVHWIAARGKTYLDDQGDQKVMMGVVRKVTDKKIASEELSRVYALEKKARDEAEEANRAKDFFLAVVSHELRSPLNAILGWTKILLTKKIDEKTTRNALETIEKSARSQAKLIEDLVDSARVASGKLRLELRPVNLYEVIKTVYNLQRPAAESKNVNIEFLAETQNFQVFGDSIRLQQIFTNLLSNALKFTKENGSIQIQIKTDAPTVTVSIKDTGQGINPEFLPNVFRQFRQGEENAPSSQTGLGLGLSIVKILVEKHNGIVWAESAGIGHGSTFSVTLPLYETETDINYETKKDNPSDEKHLTGIKILIVEDDSDSREVLQLFLEQNGARVNSVESAHKAINSLNDAAGDLPDIIISDLAMPEEDGYSLLTRIRESGKAEIRHIPALALSAFATNDNKQRAFNAGFQKYHTKPFEPDVIVQDIIQLVKTGN